MQWLFLAIRRPLVFALHLLEENRTALESFLKSNKNASLCSNRVTILALVATPTSFFHSHFPINILRNIGIRNAQTSHFLYLDTDIMILPQTYPELKQLLSSFRNDSRTVVVFPVFFSTTGTVPKGIIRDAASCRRPFDAAESEAAGLLHPQRKLQQP